MRTDKNILIAFILNLSFSAFEFIGGIITGSVAIISDAVHDISDAASIGISYFLERKSQKQPDEKYTYGYARCSAAGGMITTFILLLGSVAVIYNSINKIINPAPINYSGMIVFAVIGVAVNFGAAYMTRDGESLNQKAVNLHMLEDTLGWVAVLIGAIVMRFTDFAIIDPIISIGVALFIFINAAKNLKEILELFLAKTPRGISVDEIKQHLSKIEGVINVHHIHIWSLDGINHVCTMHIVTEADTHVIKDKVRTELKNHGICHATLETEDADEHCHEEKCTIGTTQGTLHHHHHH